MAKSVRYVMTIDANGSPAVSELGKVESAVGDVDDAVGDVDDAVGDLEGSFGGIGSQLSDLAGPIGVGALAGGLVTALDTAAGIANEAEILAGFLGISIEDASSLQAVFSDFGLDREGFLGAMEQFVTRLSETPELADELGIALGPDGVLDPVQAIKTALENWDLLTPTEKVELFGEEGVRAVEKIIASGEELETLIEDLPDARIITPEERQNLQEYSDAVADIKGIWESIAITIANEVGPAIRGAQTDGEGLKEIAKGVWDQITDWGSSIDLSVGSMDKLRDGLSTAEQNAAGLNGEIEGIVRSVELIPDDVDVDVNVRTNWVNGLPPGYSFPARPSTTVNQTINLGRAATAADVAAASAAWRHMNGR